MNNDSVFLMLDEFYRWKIMDMFIMTLTHLTLTCIWGLMLSTPHTCIFSHFLMISFFNVEISVQISEMLRT